MTNAYHKFKCSACLKGKSAASSQSALLEIASCAAKKAKTLEKALSLVPTCHKPAIPSEVIS
eukprot:CAMPEP_0195529664 /NCGR_PEP_ID=MMETSP0794_2-20130614/32286_1 /TAXON_ID=515487 /ORGANISM="Stephanopyxis turris, Strain CCMP 815" /LENGTH=61 /DNA_ID=CAMNT_0040661015 /DNA_START=6 /DNA_END=188 /DNA_ORIENTATION=+